MLVILPKIELEQIKSIKHSTLISLASGMRIASGVGQFREDFLHLRASAIATAYIVLFI
jgi:hypothetical protein